MGKFEDRLWQELVHKHGTHLAEISRPAGKPRHGVRRGLLAGTSLCVAALGAAVAVVLSAAGSSPAFAVTRNQDGTVNVVIRQLGAIHSANARLAALGLKARFVQVSPGCVPPPPPTSPSPYPIPKGLRKSWVRVVGGSVNARFDPREVPSGQTVIVGAWRADRVVHVSPARLVRAAAAPCLRPPPGAVRGVIARFRSGAVGHCSVQVFGPANGNDAAPRPTALTPGTNTTGPPPPGARTTIIGTSGPAPNGSARAGAHRVPLMCSAKSQVLPPGKALPLPAPPTPTTPTTPTK